MRLPALCPVVWHVPIRLSADGRGAALSCRRKEFWSSPPILPAAWEVRIVDENIRPASAMRWPGPTLSLSAACMSRRPRSKQLARRAQAAGKTTVLGGPSVSASPEQYPEFDYLHLGELGDATDALIRAIDEDCYAAAAQQRFATQERLPLADFPIPAYELIDGRRYFIGSVQFSSGCPYRCEFCDIPALYGRQPRLKTPQQILTELDALLAAGIKTSIYFVDDNFIGNKKAARELLPHLVAWQKRRGYPVQLCCEATLNIAKSPEILAMMREAYFCTVFCGIESPELAALDAMQKSQNRAVPLLDAVATINSYGIEVVSGIILGLDTDTPQTADRLIEFIDRSQIPMLTINLLQALPKTPLWDRLRDGRPAKRRRGPRVRTSSSSAPMTRCCTIGAGRSAMPTRRKRFIAAFHGTQSTPTAIGSRCRCPRRASIRVTCAERSASLLDCCSVSGCSAITAAISGEWHGLRCAPGASRS